MHCTQMEEGRHHTETQETGTRPVWLILVIGFGSRQPSFIDVTSNISQLLVMEAAWARAVDCIP